MNARAIRLLLRELTVLSAAMAFVLMGALLPRLQAEAGAQALASGQLTLICHGYPGAGDDPSGAPTDHSCDHCSACHLIGMAALPSLASVPRNWLTATPSRLPNALAGTARAALPYATGPPHFT